VLIIKEKWWSNLNRKVTIISLEKEVVIVTKSKSIFFLLVTLLFSAHLAYCQEAVGIRKTITINGTVAKVDAVGSIIELKINEGQMAFSVPDDASITEGTKKIGLMDIEMGDPVTIGYYSSSPGKFVVVSITANKNS